MAKKQVIHGDPEKDDCYVIETIDRPVKTKSDPAPQGLADTFLAARGATVAGVARAWDAFNFPSGSTQANITGTETHTYKVVVKKGFQVTKCQATITCQATGGFNGTVQGDNAVALGTANLSSCKTTPPAVRLKVIPKSSIGKEKLEVTAKGEVEQDGKKASVETKYSKEKVVGDAGAEQIKQPINDVLVIPCDRVVSVVSNMSLTATNASSTFRTYTSRIDGKFTNTVTTNRVDVQCKPVVKKPERKLVDGQLQELDGVKGNGAKAQGQRVFYVAMAEQVYARLCDLQELLNGRTADLDQPAVRALDSFGEGLAIHSAYNDDNGFEALLAQADVASGRDEGRATGLLMRAANATGVLYDTLDGLAAMTGDGFALDDDEMAAIQSFSDQVMKMVLPDDVEMPEVLSELIFLEGVDQVLARRFSEAGIYSFSDLSRANGVKIEGVSDKRLQRFKNEATIAEAFGENPALTPNVLEFLTLGMKLATPEEVRSLAADVDRDAIAAAINRGRYPQTFGAEDVMAFLASLEPAENV